MGIFVRFSVGECKSKSLKGSPPLGVLYIVLVRSLHSMSEALPKEETRYVHTGAFAIFQNTEANWL